MYKDIEKRQSLLQLVILPHQNILKHFCWDNFDLLEETLHIAGTTHTAYGLSIQETTGGGTHKNRCRALGFEQNKYLIAENRCSL